MKTLVTFLFAALVFGSASVAFGQLYAPEGANMPGAWSTGGGGSWNNPPGIPVFAGILDTVPPTGLFLLDTNLATRRYRTLVNVQSSGGDVTGGTYKWLFTTYNGFGGGFWGNRWNRTTPVIINSIQSYNHNTGTDSNSVTLVNGKYYTVNYKDNSYTTTDAIWMETSAAPVGIASVTQSPLPGAVDSTDTVTVTVTLAGSTSAEEFIFIRYTTNNFTGSTILSVPIFGISGTAKIPPQAGGSTVKYYAFSSTSTFPTGDYDMRTLRHNNNNKLNYSYTVNASQYTIDASAGPNGTINPSGVILVSPGADKAFAITPSGGYYVDSVAVDGSLVDSTTSYTFVNVTANHTIYVSFTQKNNVTFQVKMNKKMQDGVFRPDSGDIVTVRGSFNGWGDVANTDTLTDLDNDSIYTITKLLKNNTGYAHKFWKTERGGQGYETSISDRQVSIGAADTTIPAVWFDNDAPPEAQVNVTFQVDMSVKMLEGTFRPDLGDAVQVKGGFNGWGGTDTLTDGDNDSIYVKTLGIAGNSTIAYKFWKTLRGGMEWEDNIPDRSADLGTSDTTLTTVFFDNDNTVGVNVSVVSGWNMISDPVDTPNDSVFHVYPASSFPYAFAFIPATGYVQRQTMENGVGYWGKFASDASAEIAGAFIIDDTIAVAAGWNMIGSISLGVDTASVIVDPPGNVASDYFGYSGGYYSATVIEPGTAYWVKAFAPGSLVLSNTASPSIPVGIPKTKVNPMDRLSSITIADAQGGHQTLYIGRQGQLTVPVERFELPPAGPDGVFDARFASGRQVELLANMGNPVELPIDINSAAYPLAVSWDIVEGSASGLVLSDAFSGRFIAARELSGTGTLQIQNPAVNRVVLRATASEIPGEFALQQNYPNPFNPSTSIRYAVPVDALVTVKVFDVLGREIVTLANEIQNAGVKSLTWDGHNSFGSQVASGLYFYRMEAQPTGNGSAFTSTRKMMLLK